MVSVLIAGAGPCGLLLANLLGAQGVDCLLIEKRQSQPVWSRAIGITPPSLCILQGLGLDDALIQDGVCIRQVWVRDRHRVVGALSFDGLTGNYPFILSLPQEQTMRQLTHNLSAFPSVEVRPGVALEAFDQADGQVVCRVRNQLATRDETVTARLLVGCDGVDSTVRLGLGCSLERKRYPQVFAMGEAPDETAWGDDAQLFFTRYGSVESFPLPDRWRRWVVLRADDGASDDAMIVQQVQRIAGIALAREHVQRVSAFQPLRQLATLFYKGRVVLCGDAAHVMSPIGGQGMNTGFADAARLARILPAILDGTAALESAFSAYDTDRKRDFRIASRWAAAGMWVGTRTGAWGSAVRNGLIGTVLRVNPMRSYLAARFAMLRRPVAGAILAE